MSVRPYSRRKVKQIIDLYRETFPEIPTNNEQIYESDDAMMWDGYLEPVEKLNNLFSDLFRYSVFKKQTDIKRAQEVGGADELDIRQIAYFMSDVLVHEKTHQGLFSTMLKNGVIDRVVNRLEKLMQGGSVSWWKIW